MKKLLLVALIAFTATALGFAGGKPEVKEWTVPFLNALTGPIASIGEYLEWGAERAAKEINGRVLFADVNIEVSRGERIAIIGDNGCG